jgi:hypothetical protein
MQDLWQVAVQLTEDLTSMNHRRVTTRLDSSHQPGVQQSRVNALIAKSRALLTRCSRARLLYYERR